MSGQIAAIVRYVPRRAGTARSHALSSVRGHKMTTGTKSGKAEDVAYLGAGIRVQREEIKLPGGLINAEALIRIVAGTVGILCHRRTTWHPCDRGTHLHHINFSFPSSLWPIEKTTQCDLGRTSKFEWYRHRRALKHLLSTFSSHTRIFHLTLSLPRVKAHVF